MVRGFAQHMRRGYNAQRVKGSLWLPCLLTLIVIPIGIEVFSQKPPAVQESPCPPVCTYPFLLDWAAQEAVYLLASLVKVTNSREPWLSAVCLPTIGFVFQEVPQQFRGQICAEGPGEPSGEVLPWKGSLLCSSSPAILKHL